MFTIAELEGFVREVLAELHRIIGGLSFTISSHNEKDTAIIGNLIEVFKVVLLRIAHE